MLFSPTKKANILLFGGLQSNSPRKIVMDPLPPFTGIPNTLPITCTSGETFESIDSSLSPNHNFVARPSSQFQFPATIKEPKASEAMGYNLTPHTQPLWGDEEPSFTMAYLSQEIPAYTDRFSPWNSAVSTISDPQSPRSSNSSSFPGLSSTASPAYGSLGDDVHLSTLDTLLRYSTPSNPLPFDQPVVFSKPQGFEIPLEQRSPFDYDIDSWSGSQSDRNVTPEQQWFPPLSTDQVGFQQAVRKSKPRQQSTSRAIRKTTEKRPTSAPGRNRRRRGATNTTNAEGTTRTFVCSFASYGCESTFVSKNEWKRHVTSQHLQLGFYRCNVGKCNARIQAGHPSHYPFASASSGFSRDSSPPPGQPNDFNRKDLFTQHQRRMHAPWQQPGRRRTPSDAEQAAFESGLEDVRQRCWHGLRRPPLQSQCIFCREVFSGEGSWDVRMEHIGRHFEREDRQTLSQEIEDIALRDWGLHEGILNVIDGQCRLASLGSDI